MSFLLNLDPDRPIRAEADSRRPRRLLPKRLTHVRVASSHLILEGFVSVFGDPGAPVSLRPFWSAVIVSLIIYPL